MKKALLHCCLALTALPMLLIAAESYDFPFTDPFKATVFGTPRAFKADLPQKIHRREFGLDLFPGSEPPEVFWFHKKFNYSVVYQKKPAPLVFSIAGTGGKFDGGNMQSLEKAFFSAGYNVISLTSPTHPNFIVGASQSRMPGYLEKDAHELYSVMKQTLADAQRRLGDNLQVTDFYLTGYSLGAAHSAFISKLDESEKAFNFEKVLLINPPVSLYNSVTILDGYVDQVGQNGVRHTVNSIFDRFSDTISHADHIELTPEFLYQMFVEAKVNDKELAQLIGLAFRLSSTDMIYAIDVMRNFGAITYKNHKVGKFESLSHSFQRGIQNGFLVYFEYGLTPYYLEQDPTLTRDDLLQRLSLTEIEDYLKTSNKIGLVTNEDDIILTPVDLAFLKKTFSDRAWFYPHGGHCGNMDEKRWVNDMLAFFESGNGGQPL